MLLSPFTMQRLTAFISNGAHSSIKRLAEFIQTGDVVAAVGQRFTLENTADAIRQMEAGATRGKSIIVVRVSGNDGS
jgi:NADPH:quinone reductase-like Zn-dependent oxidoreductase